MIMVYCYVLKLNESFLEESTWSKKDYLIIEEHFQRIKQDYEKGIVLQVGRTVDHKNDGFGLVVFKAKNKEEAVVYMNNDPAVKNKIMTARVHDYKIIFN